MQDDGGLKALLARPWIYNLYQDIVGATRGRKWVSEHFWKVKPGQKVVDVGCGPGNASRHLPRGTRYVGFDISAKYIESARKAFADDPDKAFVLGTPGDFVSELPESMRDADLVIMGGLLHHLDDEEALDALRLAHKALAPQGRLVALEGTFLVKQSPLARWFVGLDRGRNVRTEPEWRALVRRVFDDFETFVLTGLDRTPYTYIVIEARRQGGGMRGEDADLPASGGRRNTQYSHSK